MALKKQGKKRVIKKRALGKIQKNNVLKPGVKAKLLKVVSKKMEKPVGRVTHYFRKIKVAIVKFSKPVRAGALLYFRGATTDFKQEAESLQYNHKPLRTAPKGKQVGIKVLKRVREGDKVYVE